MDLKITGRVVDVLEEESGTGKHGPWRKQEFILETEGQYPKQVCVAQWGDNIEKFDVEEGERVTAHIDIQSREYQGRWYTDVKAWRIERPEDERAEARDDEDMSSDADTSSDSLHDPPSEADSFGDESEWDDLPF